MLSATDEAIATRLRELGDDPSPEAIAATASLYARLHEHEPYAGVRVRRAVAYGDHPRQRFDLFTSEVPARRAGVLVYAHAGGYVSGDRRLEWPEYYDNVALWAVRHGMVALLMSYRLAPEYGWPAGAEDLGAVVAWCRANVAAHHGDPERIVLMGHSAGAAHIASYIARAPASPIAAAILASGVYDIPNMERSQNHIAYFGADASRYAERSSVEGLVATRIPILLSYAEYDPRKFVLQASTVLRAIVQRRARPIPSICLPGHTHFSQVFHLGAAGVDDYYSRLLLAFVGTALGRQA